VITAIEIENFKGIGERVRIELKPITLLFGPNSAGKSTILHALHYAREIFERRNLDADQTLAGGQFVDLGGFRNLVHGRDLERSVILRFELDIDSHENLIPWIPFNLVSESLGPHIEHLTHEFSTAKVTIEIRYSTLHERLYVRRYAVDLAGEPFAEIVHDPDRKATVLQNLNTKHPVLLRFLDILPAPTNRLDIRGYKISFGDTNRTLLQAGLEYIREVIPYTGDQTWPLHPSTEDALPDFRGSVLGLVVEEQDDSESMEDSVRIQRVAAELKTGLSKLIAGPGEWLRWMLECSCYIGPIRETPRRDFLPLRSHDPGRWASGLAAWDILGYGVVEVVQKTSDWLSQQDRLNTGYRVERRHYKELDLSDPLLAALATGRAFDEADKSGLSINQAPTRARVVLVSELNELALQPSEIGIGVSQLLPVVVAACLPPFHEPFTNSVLLEQPELHLHPRIQAAMGDLFIETTKESRRCFLIETHSEHLILRILRRIRETVEGEVKGGRSPVTPEDVAVYYIQQESGKTVADLLRVDETGEFIDPWPQGFFEERAKELFGE
jgi:AAA ATPase domain/Protein of unknown function (DUF3696)